MMKKYALIFSSLLILVFPLSCTSDYPYTEEAQMEDAAESPDSESGQNDPTDPPDTEGATDSDDTGTNDPNAGLITYRADVAPILNQLCVACHNASLQEDDVDISTYELAKREIDEIIESMQEEEDEDDIMPPSGRVDNAILQTLIYWKSDGLLEGETPPEDTGSGTSDGTYTYTGDILTLFEDHCILCHGANSPAAGFDMSTYQKTVDQIDQILSTIDRQTGQQGVMPPAGRLDEVSIQKIKDWIDQGMPE